MVPQSTLSEALPSKAVWIDFLKLITNSKKQELMDAITHSLKSGHEHFIVMHGQPIIDRSGLTCDVLFILGDIDHMCCMYVARHEVTVSVCMRGQEKKDTELRVEWNAVLVEQNRHY